MSTVKHSSQQVLLTITNGPKIYYTDNTIYMIIHVFKPAHAKNYTREPLKFLECNVRISEKNSVNFRPVL